MRYRVTVATESTTHDGFAGVTQSPTFLLDSTVQGITSPEHAEHIVRAWLGDAGLNVLAVTVVAEPTSELPPGDSSFPPDTAGAGISVVPNEPTRFPPTSTTTVPPWR